MEIKMKFTVAKTLAANDEEKVIGDVAAVFIPDWNKFIRGELKVKLSNGKFHVWAIDYGIPFIVKPCYIRKLPDNYAKMNANYQRIYKGGLINCIPAQSRYDFDTDSLRLVEETNWCQEALDIARKVIDRATQLKFDFNGGSTKTAMKQKHVFGHLKAEKADGSWMDLANCLVKASVAKRTTVMWNSVIHQLNTTHSDIFKTMDGQLLTSRTTVVPILFERNEVAESIHQDSIKPDDANRNDNSNQNKEVSGTQHPNISMEHRPYKTSRSLSASRIFSSSKPFRSYKTQNTFTNQYRGRWNDQSAFPPGWHDGKLQNRRYCEEIAYFESAFKKPGNERKTLKIEKDPNQNKPENVANTRDENVSHEKPLNDQTSTEKSTKVSGLTPETATDDAKTNVAEIKKHEILTVTCQVGEESERKVEISNKLANH